MSETIGAAPFMRSQFALDPTVTYHNHAAAGVARAAPHGDNTPDAIDLFGEVL